MVVRLFFLFFIVYPFAVEAQVITGSVGDYHNSQPLKGVVVFLYKNDKIVTTDTTNENGRYTLCEKNATSCYQIKINHLGYISILLDSVFFMKNGGTYQNFYLKKQTSKGDSIELLVYKAPLIKKDEPCPYISSNGICPVCKKKGNVIPVACKTKLGEHYDLCWQKIINHEKGNIMSNEFHFTQCGTFPICTPHYYCKKDKLLF